MFLTVGSSQGVALGYRITPRWGVRWAWSRWGAWQPVGSRGMKGQGTFVLRGRNPDVSTCIANLSNDEAWD